MDIDKPLDELIPQKKAGRGRAPGGGGGGDRKPRVSRDRAEPYARPPPRSTEERWVHDAFDGRRGRGGDARGGERDSRDRRGPPAEFVGASPRIMVSGIHYEVTKEDLQVIFSQAGTIVQGPTIHYDRSGRSTGNATIEYASAQQAKAAINKFDGAMTKGQTISIKLIAPARPPAQKQSSSSLLDRLAGGGGSLQDRIGGGGRDSPRGGGRGERGERAPARGGRGAERGRGGRGGAGAKPARAKRGPATAEDLDAQLAAYSKPEGGDVAME